MGTDEYELIELREWFMQDIHTDAVSLDIEVKKDE